MTEDEAFEYAKMHPLDEIDSKFITKDFVMKLFNDGYLLTTTEIINSGIKIDYDIALVREMLTEKLSTVAKPYTHLKTFYKKHLTEFEIEKLYTTLRLLAS